MKKNKRKFVRALVCLATLSPIMTACSCSTSTEQKQTVEYKIAKGNAPHGTYTLVFDDVTRKVKINAIPDVGYEFERAYYVHMNNPTVEYDIPEEGFTKPNANITVYVKFVEKEEPIILTAQLNLQQSTNGMILVEDTTPEAGETVKITVLPNEGYFASKLYYVRHDESEAEISNNTFTMIDEPIVVKVEFSKFYGTYKVASNIDDLAFFDIDKQITIGHTVTNATSTSYSLSTYDYLINNDVITFVDNDDVIHNIQLSSNQFSDTINNTTTLYTLTADSDFYYARYDRIDHTAQDLDYIWSEDGTIKEVLSENTGIFIEEKDFATATIYGDVLVLKLKENNNLVVLNVSKGATHYTLSGKEFTTTEAIDTEWSFALDTTSSRTTLAPSQFGTYELSYNYTTGRIEITNTPDTGYILSEMFYLIEGSNVKYYIPNTGFNRPATGNITVHVTFKVDPSYPIRAEVASNITGGSITLNTLKMLNAGDEVSITTTPYKGYYLKEVYYMTSDNQKVIIENDKFTMIEDVITINATFIKYYGTYFISNVVDSNGNTVSGSATIVENNNFNFLYIDETGVYMPLIETVEERYYSKYEMIRGTYELGTDKITLKFKIGNNTITQVLTLHDEKLRSPYGTGTFLQYTLARDSGFTPGPYQVTEITESITEFIFNENNTVTSTTDGTRIDVGTYTQYGNMVIIENFDGTIDVCTLTKNSNTIIVAGMRINFLSPNTSESNRELFYWTFIAK